MELHILGMDILDLREITPEKEEKLEKIVGYGGIVSTALLFSHKDITYANEVVDKIKKKIQDGEIDNVVIFIDRDYEEIERIGRTPTQTATLEEFRDLSHMSITDIFNVVSRDELDDLHEGMLGHKPQHKIRLKGNVLDSIIKLWDDCRYRVYKGK